MMHIGDPHASDRDSQDKLIRRPAQLTRMMLLHRLPAHWSKGKLHGKLMQNNCD